MPNDDPPDFTKGEYSGLACPGDSSRVPALDPALLQQVSAYLDRECAREYQDQPLAQHWARVAKLAEEAGEAIAELIVWTGQNPRKPADPAAYSRMLHELADAALTGAYAIQHFTGDSRLTMQLLREAQGRHAARLSDTGMTT